MLWFARFIESIFNRLGIRSALDVAPDEETRTGRATDGAQQVASPIQEEIPNLENTDRPPPGKNDQLIKDLTRIVVDKLTEYEQDRDLFNRRALTLLIPGSEGTQLWLDALERGREVRDLIKNRKAYVRGSSEAAFENLYIRSLAVWSNTKAKESEPINPKVTEYVTAEVELFVSALGDERKGKKSKKKSAMEETSIHESGADELTRAAPEAPASSQPQDQDRT